MPLPELLNELERRKEKRTWADLAEELGVGVSTLWRIMNGQRTPRLDTLEQLFEAQPDLRRVFFSPDAPNGDSDVPNSDNGGPA